jgi:hypothetical protein
MMQKTSMAMVQTAPRTLEAQSLPIPEIDEDSALMRIEACGICGSDYEQYEGVIRAPMPAVPGHEPLGIIEAIGDRAAKRWGVDVGDRVAVETMLPCRFCSQCLGGRYHLCDDRRIYSYIPLSDAPGLWGAYSEYMFVHGNSIVQKMDKTLAPEIAVMFNPLGAGYRWAVEVPGRLNPPPHPGQQGGARWRPPNRITDVTWTSPENPVLRHCAVRTLPAQRDGLAPPAPSEQKSHRDSHSPGTLGPADRLVDWPLNSPLVDRANYSRDWQDCGQIIACEIQGTAL